MIHVLHTHARHASRMCSLDFQVKGQGHEAMIIVRVSGPQLILKPLMIIKLPTLAPHESRICPYDLRAKGQRSRLWGISDFGVKWFWLLAIEII